MDRSSFCTYETTIQITDTFTSHEAILKSNDPLHVTKVVILSTVLQVSTSIRVFSRATVCLNILNNNIESIKFC